MKKNNFWLKLLTPYENTHFRSYFHLYSSNSALECYLENSSSSFQSFINGAFYRFISEKECKYWNDIIDRVKNQNAE